MAKRDILKEAIADAKAVKETAIANAKAALEEAFTPQLKSMLAAKLEEMELDEEKEVDEMLKKNKDMRDDKPGTPEYKTEYEVKPMEEDLDEEIDLDEILAEIELDEEKDNLNEDEATDKEEEGFLDGKKDGEEEEKEDMEDDEIDLDDMSDEDLKGFIEDVIADMVASGELEAGENFEEEDEETEEVVDTTDVDVEISEGKKKKDDKEEVKESTDVEEVNTMGGGGSMVVKRGPDGKPLNKYDRDFMKAVKDDLTKLMKKIGLKEEELSEAYSTIETLKSDLNEVNLLNAKLLYTNKIFKAKTLTESQKVKVLGAFDKAGTVKETKLVFETLNEGLKTKKSPIKESLGAASRVSRSVNAKKPIIETDPMVERFKKLAGLK